MNSKFEIIRYGIPGFNHQLNEFICETKTSPVYATQFSEYYQEVQNQMEQNCSTLVMHEGKPILGLIFSRYSDKSDNQAKITYFGLPAIFAIADTREVSVINEGLKILLQSLNDSKISVSRGRISYPRMIQIRPEILCSTRVEKFVLQDCYVKLRFDRILQLSQTKLMNKAEYSKSAREAIKNKSLNIFLTSNRNSEKVIEKDFKRLKELHLLSAGRKTRSEISWELQLEMVKKGSAVLISGEIENETVTSALFMLNSKSSFYGVSATNNELKHTGASHKIIDFAVDNLPSFGVEEVWLGAQYSDTVATTSEKERSIEEFKGYFGGFIQTHLISTMDT